MSTDLLSTLRTTIPAHALSEVFGSVVAVRNALFDRFPRFSAGVERPVVSVGGVHCGGTGKTPMCRLIIGLVKRRGATVAVLSRGYGRRSRRPVIARPGQQFSWKLIGDEPALLSSEDVWLGIGADRIRSARTLMPYLPENSVFVLDDGFQRRQMRRNFDIVCLPPSPFDDRLLPSGTLREPLTALSRADAVCLVGQKCDEEKMIQTRRLLAQICNTQVYSFYQIPGPWVNAVDGTPETRPPLDNPVVITAIARPGRFLSTLSDLGISPAQVLHFPDHHPFSAKEIARIPNITRKGIITTEKDAQRLRELDLVQRPAMWYLRIDLEFAEKGDQERFVQALDSKIKF